MRRKRQQMRRMITAVPAVPSDSSQWPRPERSAPPSFYEDVLDEETSATSFGGAVYVSSPPPAAAFNSPHSGYLSNSQPDVIVRSPSANVIDRSSNVRTVPSSANSNGNRNFGFNASPSYNSVPTYNSAPVVPSYTSTSSSNSYGVPQTSVFSSGNTYVSSTPSSVSSGSNFHRGNVLLQQVDSLCKDDRRRLERRWKNNLISHSHTFAKHIHYMVRGRRRRRRRR